MTADGVADDQLIHSWGLVVEGVSRTRQRLLASVEQDGLSGTLFEALHLLLRAEGNRLPMSHLARDLSMTAGGLTKLADRLARDGLIDRRSSDGDRRVVYAALTDKGIALAEKTAEIYRAALREHVLGPLGRDRLDELAALVATLREVNVPDLSAVEEQLAITRDPRLPERRASDRKSDRGPDGPAGGRDFPDRRSDRRGSN